MSIPDWPALDRPREKLLQRGAESLSDAELLAIFLRTGIKGCSAVDLAKQLLDLYGGIRPLFESSQQDFCAARGLGPAKYVQLKATIEMNRRYLADALSYGSVMDTPATVQQYLIAQLRHLKKEAFACLFLDTKHRVIGFDILFQGSINSASVYPREVVKSILSYNASAVIFSHNHPSGNPEPSLADVSITKDLKEALRLIDVTVLDHIIIGNQAPVSLAERGLI